MPAKQDGMAGVWNCLIIQREVERQEAVVVVVGMDAVAVMTWNAMSAVNLAILLENVAREVVPEQ